MYLPSATYRLQLGPGFGFADAAALAPYLAELGVTDLYLSPITRARTGSTHGYDVADHAVLAPSLGGEAGWALLADEVRRRGLGLVLDVVPNHMVASSENPHWLDVLENGRGSRFAKWFDIDWRHGKASMEGKVLLPILGKPFGGTLEDQELRCSVDAAGFFVAYHGRRLPLEPRSWAVVMRRWLELFPGDELARLVAEVEAIPGHGDAPRAGDRMRARRRAAEAIAELSARSSAARETLLQAMAELNGRKGEPQSFDRLDALLDLQHYRLVWWRLGPEEVNYRRFFNISDLVGVRIEEPQVFEEVHALVFRLAREAPVSGVRVDHVDGLLDPLKYLRRLRRGLAAGGREGEGWLVVEKILGPDEGLPPAWPVAGTTGYDFMDSVGRLLVDPAGLESLGRTWRRFTGQGESFGEVAYREKKRITDLHFAAETKRLERKLVRLAERDRHARDLSARELRNALVETTACFPLYRSYVRTMDVPAADRRRIAAALGAARARAPDLAVALDFLGRVLLLEFPSSLPAAERPSWLRFVLRWQQFTGPVAAKAVEDTAFYVFHRLVSLNEVGCDPDPDPATLPVGDFHRRNRLRRERAPATMNATSTHDTKRSEDVRARIHALSEEAVPFRLRVSRWSRWNAAHRARVGKRRTPDRSEELLLYQTLLGVWPLAEAGLEGLPGRLVEYAVKAAREAKVHTRWSRPDPEHESALAEFVRAILDRSRSHRFLADFAKFQQRIARLGATNSLAQVVLKICSPGVPDLYQGTELWDLSLVDPDNRRPVDFELRKRALAELDATPSEDLLLRWQDGRIKMLVTRNALRFRRVHRELFAGGEYLELRVVGRRAEHACAFARRRGDEWAVAVVPVRTARLGGGERFPIGHRVWRDTWIELPAGAPAGAWEHVIAGGRVAGDGGRLGLAEVLGSLPVALLRG